MNNICIIINKLNISKACKYDNKLLEVAGGAGGGPGPGDVVDRLRAANAGREEATYRAPWPRKLRHPAVPGPRGDPADAGALADVAGAQVLGKPPAAVQKIVEGKLEKFYSTVCLLDQPFVKDAKGEKTIEPMPVSSKAASRPSSVQRLKMQMRAAVTGSCGRRR